MGVRVWDLGRAVGWKSRPVLVLVGPVNLPGSLGGVKCVPAPVTFCLCPWPECLGDATNSEILCQFILVRF